MKQAEVDASKIPDNPNLTKSDTQVTQVGDQAPMDPMTAMVPRKISKKIKKLNQKDVSDYIHNYNYLIKINQFLKNYKMNIFLKER